MEIFNNQNRDWEHTFDAIEDWIAIINLDSTILKSNISVENYFQVDVKDAVGSRCCRIVHGTEKSIKGCPLPKMLKTGQRESAQVQIKDGRWMLITVDPIVNSQNEMLSAVHIIRDITADINSEIEKQQLIKNLKVTLDRVKMLSGLIPICSNCKKIRDDKGYWNMLETYIEKYSEALYTHSICPKCSKELYGNDDWDTV